MAEKSADESVPLTLHLSEDLAERLKLAALNQRRAAADVAVALLEKHLPRLQSPETKKKKIPYT